MKQRSQSMFRPQPGSLAFSSQNLTRPHVRKGKGTAGSFKFQAFLWVGNGTIMDFGVLMVSQPIRAMVRSREPGSLRQCGVYTAKNKCCSS